MKRSKRTKQLNIRITPEERHRLDALAEKMAMSPAGLVRMLIRGFRIPEWAK